MFSSEEILDKYRSYKPRIVDAVRKINIGDSAEGRHDLEGLKNEIKAFNEELESPSEQVLNELFLLRSYIQFLILYSIFWEKLEEQKFGNSWHSLQDAISQYRIVKKFSCENDESIFLPFFENQILSLEKLYPYNVFFSMGAVVDYYECNICGLDIDSDECPHFKGELYSGVMAVAIAKNFSQVDHVSMVKHPADKRCVVQYDDDGEQFNLIRYLSNLLKEKEILPFDFGELRFSEKIIQNPDYVKLGRNQKCFCGSGKKFKHCCIDKKTVNSGHVDIISNPTSVENILA
ncbi:MAG: SEC-C domain-containing protein [Deltaproteobacteria bacterium]|nr:SEC-C domain-containing protein [Deltaproteobacteria bacterium]